MNVLYGLLKNAKDQQVMLEVQMGLPDQAKKTLFNGNKNGEFSKENIDGC